MIKNILHILFLLLVISGWGQQYNFQKYSIEDGLPRSAVYALCEDKDGFLWIGLEGGGVSMFDGKRFTNYDMSSGLPSHKVRAVFQDSQGFMWFGTSEGICRYNFDTIEVFTTENGLCNNYIRTITEDHSGNIWIGTNKGISQYSNGTFKNFSIHNGLLDDKIRIILIDHNGNVIVGTDSGMNVFNGEYFDDYLLNYYLPHPTVLELFEDCHHQLWIGTQDGVMQVDGEKITIYTEEDGLITNRVRAIVEDKYHNIWMGTRSGVSKLDLSKENNRFTTYNQSNGLSHDRIRDIILDSRGNLWFATYFGGIDRFSGNDFTTYTTDEGLISNQIFSISGDKNHHIILGTFDGVTKLKFNNGHLSNIKNLTEAEGLSDNRVFDIIKDTHGYYWYGTQDGLTISNNDQTFIINKERGLVDNQITAILQVDNDSYWIGTEQGISKITFTAFPSEYKVINFEQDEITNLAGNEVSAFVLDHFNNLWVGFRNGGVSIVTANGHVISPKLPESIDNVTTIKRGTDQSIWIGTGANGLFKITNDNSFDQTLTVTNYGKNNGLNSNHIYAVQVDNLGNVWAGSERGLDNLIFDQNSSLTRVIHYGTKEGLKGIEINENAAYLDYQNNLWFGTVEGVSYLNTSRLKQDTTPPNVFISGIDIFDTPINSLNTFNHELKGRFQLPEALHLPYDMNSVRFELTPLYLRSADKVQLKWMLEGFDPDWQAPTKTRVANYTNLPPGEYTFKVLAGNENDDWTTIPKTIKVTIDPPFWQTIWFLILVGIVGFLLFSFISQWRVGRLIKAKEELERKISIATQELRKEKELIEIQNSQIEKQKDQLTEINTSITDSINYAKRIQRAVMAPNTSSAVNIKDKAFVFHRPKDIVSGDFFWFRDLHDSSYFTAADCTGHGVPGAFMSMIGITYLNQIIDTSHEEVSPDAVLFELRRNIINALKNEGADKAKDGMDMGLCRIDWKNKKVYYSGANNPMYHVRNGVLTELKPNKMPIGEHDLRDHPFDLHELQLEEGDMIYLFSDGYPDQFGGPKGKKYKYKPFMFFLESIYDHPLEKQHDALANEFERWRGEHEQIDDICIIGVRI